MMHKYFLTAQLQDEPGWDETEPFHLSPNQNHEKRPRLRGRLHIQGETRHIRLIRREEKMCFLDLFFFSAGGLFSDIRDVFLPA